MKIDATTFAKLPEHLQALFDKAPNLGCDEVLAAFPDSNGSGPARKLNRSAKPEQQGWGMNTTASDVASLRDAGTGSAARFFYAAKASKRDRDEGLDGWMVRAPCAYAYF